jgi:hypothetical protein
VAEFDIEISRRAASTADALAAARADGDDFLESVHLGELAELRRIAGEHGVELSHVAS